MEAIGAIADVDEVLFLTLEHKLLDGPQQAILASRLADKSYATAMRVAQAIQDVRHRACAFRDIAAAQARRGNLLPARELVAAAIETVWSSDSAYKSEGLRDIAAAQTQVGLFADAATAAGRIEHVATRAEALSALSFAQAKAGLLADALTSAKRIDTHERIHYRHSRTEALVNVARTQVMAGDVTKGRETFDAALKSVQEGGDFLDRSTRTREVALAQASAGLFNDSLETASQDHGRHHAQTLGEIAALQAKAGHTEEARSTFALAFERAKRSAMPSPWNAVLDVVVTVAHAGDIDSAKAWFSTLTQTALRLKDTRLRQSGIQDIVKSLTQGGLFSEARETLTLGVPAGFDHFLLKDIAVGQVRSGKFHEALHTIGEIRNDVSTKDALLDTVQQLANTTDTALAQPQWAAIVAASASIQTPDWRGEVLMAVAEAQASMGETREARAAFALALKAVQSPTSGKKRAELASRMAVDFVRASNAQSVLDVFSDVLRLAGGQELEGDLPEEVRAEVCIAAAKSLGNAPVAALAMFDRALACVPRMRDQWRRGTAMADIAIAELDMGLCAEAMSIVKQLPEEWDNCLDHRRNTIVSAQAGRGWLDDALQTAAQIKSGGLLETALQTIATASVLQGPVGFQRKRDNEMKKIASTPRLRSAVLRATGSVYAKMGNLNAAREAFGQAFLAAEKIEDESHWYESFEALALAQANATMGADAHNTAAILPERGELLCAIAAATAKTGDKECARNAFRESLRFAQKEGRDYDGARAIEKVGSISTHRNNSIRDIAEAFCSSNDRASLQRMLIPSAECVASAYRMCGFLAKLYPEQAPAIAEVLMKEADE